LYSNFKEYASDLQTFLGSKAIEGEVKKEEECLNTLAEDERLQQLSLRYNINTKIKDIGYILLSVFRNLFTLILISVKLCSMLLISVDVLDVLIISRIDKSPTQSLWFVEMQSGQQGYMYI
jgi:hypothetical protein